LSAALRDLGDPKPSIRVSAVQDLARLAQDEHRGAATEALGHALRADSSESVREAAALAIADARAVENTEVLVETAEKDSAPRVRQLCIVALGEVAPKDHPGARAAVERALDSDAPELRFQALIALHHLLGHDAIPRVVERFSDDDAQIRYVSLRIAEEHAVGGGTLPAGALDRARGKLRDAAPEVRLAAAILLASHGDRSGESVLADALNGAPRPIHAEDEQEAIELCGTLGIEPARPGLERRAWGLRRDPSQAWHARVALARMGDARARQAIVRGLAAWTRDARTMAVAAAARAHLTEARDAIARMRGDADRADPDAVEHALSVLGEQTSL
jgi:HEAT repeat protein